ncbi:hypothetical protein GCM10010441_74800 [Kitasatospora paracochleata]|uniref:Uncharacterized protein n=1 Tax=Kitasatospora paracochleata TaxID=58354 RepID=A0ABT1J4T0_9ACTN|nr:hypothetical protein [Kitasatospora paracochleata]MCP2312443.1 hypothetical protein [Kitasatospora paracochleata]
MTALTDLDLTGFTERETGVWTDPQGLILSLHHFDLVPDLPASLERPEQLQRGLAESTALAGAGLIEAVVGELDGVPAVRQLVKIPLPGRSGQAFIGSWTIPRAECSTVLKIQAGEGRMSGLREAMVADQVGYDDYFRPHPYAPELRGGLPYHVADHPEWDDRFPDHPLTLVRATLERLTPTVRLAGGFKALPPFPGSPADPEPPRPRRWFNRRR